MRIYDARTDALLASQQRDPLLKHLTRTIVALVKRHRPPKVAGRAARLIDVGCGVGRTSWALTAAGYDVVGVDPEERVVELARASAVQAAQEAGGAATGVADGADAAHAQAHFEVGDATAQPPPAWTGHFDVAVCSEVIEHVQQPESVIRYCRDVLRPGGLLILTTPHDPALWTAMDDYAGHVTRFTAAQLAGLLADADLDVLELGTEGFPFQRLVMRSYDRLLALRGGEHSFDAFGSSPAYRAYVAFMPALLRVDHVLRRLRKGTTLVVVARRRALAA